MYAKYEADISFALGMKAKYQVNSGQGHWKAVRYILGYMKMELKVYVGLHGL